MKNNPKRQEHPKIAYLIGFFFLSLTAFVLVGVVYQLAFSHHGPGVLNPVVEKIADSHKSIILEEAKQQEEYERHRHFHNVIECPRAPESAQPVCFICHSEYPHSKNKKVRSILNMHTEYFICESCHLQKPEGTKIVHNWYSPLDDDPKGPFFGTEYDQKTGRLKEVEDRISKIAPFLKQGSSFQPTIHMQDAPLAKDYVNVRDRLTPEQRAGVKKKFHVDIKPKGNECNACHSQQSILNFKKLGFDEKRIVDLEQLNISGMITKYEQFFLPDLFKE